VRIHILFSYVVFKINDRMHVDDVASVLMATSRLLAQPASHEIPKLCELRNHLLTASTHYKFITLQDVNLGTYARPMAYGGFFLDHGRPEIVIIVSGLIVQLGIIH
jgi:hypothetical protein